MRRLIALAFIWFTAGYLVGMAAGSIGVRSITPIQFGLVGLVIGLVGVATLTRTERGRRLFYEGPAKDEEGDFRIGCLWGIPFTVGLMALIAWFLFSAQGLLQ